jgi:hypothetical protein
MVKTFKRLYEVEAIVSKKAIKRKTFYLVKWQGYPSSENTWEPIENLENVKWMVDDFNQQQDAAKPVIDLIEEEITLPNKVRKPAEKKPKFSSNNTTTKPKAKQRRTRSSSPDREANPKQVEIIEEILPLPKTKSIGIQTFLLPPEYIDTLKPKYKSKKI